MDLQRLFTTDEEFEVLEDQDVTKKIGKLLFTRKIIQALVCLVRWSGSPDADASDIQLVVDHKSKTKAPIRTPAGPKRRIMTPCFPFMAVDPDNMVPTSCACLSLIASAQENLGFFSPAVSPITGCIHPRERKINTQYSSGHIYHEAYASFCTTRWSICPLIFTLASIRAHSTLSLLKSFIFLLATKRQRLVNNEFFLPTEELFARELIRVLKPPKSDGGVGSDVHDEVAARGGVLVSTAAGCCDVSEIVAVGGGVLASITRRRIGARLQAVDFLFTRKVDDSTVCLSLSQPVLAWALVDDADIDLAVKAAVFSCIGTAGQRCTTTRRLILHTKVKDVFVVIRFDHAAQFVRINIWDEM
ncbi:hypothetical protein TSAR_014890 [Trichomalopsis sarcophagae]|uniref:Aldehyde dehydrogenase domain-containing protein n=1 Tax=Trichomalopsis sarcophagae TaxID=543379 RepID=A0A232FAI0_9HYME|nr:hypothetical protein TSAR_014890 [Trichomalopsis sarcophagae]